MASSSYAAIGTTARPPSPTFRRLALALIALQLVFSPPALAQTAGAGEHWVATWGTAQQSFRGGGGPGGRGPAGAPAPVVAGAPENRTPAAGTAPPAPPQAPNAGRGEPARRFPIPPGLATVNNQTVRMIARTSIGGRRVRVRLSNAFGAAAVTLGAAHIALRARGSEIVPGTLEGINDITAGSRPNATGPRITSDDLIAAYRQMIELAHLQGVKVIGCTVTPYGGSNVWNEYGERVRDGVNRWIRTSGAFDAVVDFDAATRDPGDPVRFRPEADSPDLLHPANPGYTLMADAVALSIFATKPSTAPGNRK